VSIRSLAVVETERDVKEPLSRDGGQSKGKPEALVEAIPTEVLGPYTAIVAVMVANSKPDDWTELGRWILYGVGLALVPLAVYLLWRRGRSAQATRSVPVAGLVGSTLAFAAWGLIMPGGPLTYSISDGATLATVTSIVTIVVTAIIASLPLTRQTKLSPP
jgi:hypothetical protein